jgi:hypothetical protein
MTRTGDTLPVCHTHLLGTIVCRHHWHDGNRTFFALEARAGDGAPTGSCGRNHKERNTTYTAGVHLIVNTFLTDSLCLNTHISRILFKIAFFNLHSILIYKILYKFILLGIENGRTIQ